MMMKSENLRFVMDETGRPYEPVEPEYERAVQETPESLAFEEELVLCQDLVQVKMRNFFPF